MSAGCQMPLWSLCYIVLSFVSSPSSLIVGNCIGDMLMLNSGFDHSLNLR